MGKPGFVQTRLFFWLVMAMGLVVFILQTLSLSANEDPDDLIINEFVAANRAGLTDEDGDWSDWIEIYNRGHQAVNLAGWALTDDPAQPAKWIFPATTLESRAYLVVFASGKNRKPAQPGAELHTNFRLKQAGEFLGLYHIPMGQFADVAGAAMSRPESGTGPNFPVQLDDVAYGRHSPLPYQLPTEPAYGYLTMPTPGETNDASPVWTDLVAPLQFSQGRGLYEASFRLELTTTTPDATIRYTTDGSEPTATTGTTYTGPIAIYSTTLLRAAAFKPDFHPSAIETHSYIFIDDVRTQSADPAGFPKTWGGYQGAPVVADYEMDPEIVNQAGYGEVLDQALASIPTMSIVTDRQSFHDLYANPGRRGRAWERPASFEFFDPTADRPDFQIDAGLRIQGELGRSEFMPKHAFRLFFRGEYGAAKLNYPLFPGSPVAEFDTLILRSGVNRSYAGYPERADEIESTTYTRDEWLRASQIALSGYGSHGLFVHLYLNGLYWGLYNVVERPDTSFMASYFGDTEADWQVISHEETVTHTSDRFKTLHHLAAQGQLYDPEKYEAISSYLDVPGFIDYLILNWYSGNLDWGFNNWYAGMHQSDGPVRYFVWDGERTWFEGAEIFMEKDEYLERPNLVKPLFEALLLNPDFRMTLADRLYLHLFNEGPLSDKNAQARWLSLNNQIEQAMIAESARWGDARNDPALAQDDWFQARDDVLAQMEGNAARLITLAREAGYYPDIDPPIIIQDGQPTAAGLSQTITLSASDRGIVYYTTDGADPRLAETGTVAPNAQVYTAPLILTKPIDLKARVFNANTWSALQEAVFNPK
ncbi:MAG TPA: chitobiase/beta-hexosaminidase C-terminal domain-containing protein [Anaerolineae bacterium]